jgi:hypothetical protein
VKEFRKADFREFSKLTRWVARRADLRTILLVYFL